jgi:CRP-like cAMP-binding protein
MITNGLAYAACALPDGRRAILDTFVAGDFVALSSSVAAEPVTVYAANRMTYHLLDTAALEGLLGDPAVAAFLVAHLTERHLRATRLCAMIARLDAHARLCVLLLDIYDRLRQRGLATNGRFVLPLVQEQIADHIGLTLVHVNRTLRRLRDDKIVNSGRRQIFVIQNLDRARTMAEGLPEFNLLY